MIKLSFVKGSSLRKVAIKGRKLIFMSQETGFKPIMMDLDKIDYESIKSKMGDDGIEIIEQISKLNTEEEMATDIKNDFQRTGWRLFKKE